MGPHSLLRARGRAQHLCVSVQEGLEASGREPLPGSHISEQEDRHFLPAEPWRAGHRTGHCQGPLCPGTATRSVWPDRFCASKGVRNTAPSDEKIGVLCHLQVVAKGLFVCLFYS